MPRRTKRILQDCLAAAMLLVIVLGASFITVRLANPPGPPASVSIHAVGD